MAATINVIRNKTNCKHCLQFATTCYKDIFSLNLKKTLYLNSAARNFSLRLQKTYLINNQVKIKQRKILECNVVCFQKKFSTKSTNVEEDLEDIRHLLHTKLSIDEKISSSQLENHMNILDVLLRNRLEPVPEEKLNIVTSEISPSDMYSLASRILLLQGTVGGEASMVATPLFKMAALSGDKNAKYSYGQLLFRGAGGLEADPIQAGTMFSELAEEGHGYAQYALAGMYYTGYGVEQSFETSYTLYQVSAENGIVQSYNNIGKMYLHGDGIDKDEKKALEYFEKGAEAGDAQACMSVAHCYSNGKGIEVNYDQAFTYHNKAAERGYPPGIYNIGTHYFSGKGVGLDMKKAAECFQRAADMGFTLAEVNLGNMYYHGLGVEKNLAKAKELYQRAAPNNHNARLLLEELELEEAKEKGDN